MNKKHHLFPRKCSVIVIIPKVFLKKTYVSMNTNKMLDRHPWQTPSLSSRVHLLSFQHFSKVDIPFKWPMTLYWIFLRDTVCRPHLFKTSHTLGCTTKKNLRQFFFEERFPLEDAPRGHRMQDHAPNAWAAPWRLRHRHVIWQSPPHRGPQDRHGHEQASRNKQVQDEHRPDEKRIVRQDRDSVDQKKRVTARAVVPWIYGTNT